MVPILIKMLLYYNSSKITNTHVLEEAGRHTQHHSLLCKRRLRWIGHVRKLDDGRIPKDMFGQLKDGNRPKSRPRLRYKDVVKRDLKKTDIDIETWESIADDRSIWRTVCYEGVRKAEEDRLQNLKLKREKRKAKKRMKDALIAFKNPHCEKDFSVQRVLTNHIHISHTRNVDWT